MSQVEPLIHGPSWKAPPPLGSARWQEYAEPALGLSETLLSPSGSLVLSGAVAAATPQALIPSAAAARRTSWRMAAILRPFPVDFLRGLQVLPEEQVVAAVAVVAIAEPERA